MLRSVLLSYHNVVTVVVPQKFKKMDKLVNLSERKICIKQVNNINSVEFIHYLNELNPSLLVVAGYSEIFSSELISVASHGAINLHAGRLPEYRGGSPLNWQMLNGETEAGLSIIQMDAGIDTGDILAEQVFPIHIFDTISNIHQKANEHFASLTVSVLDAMGSGALVAQRQDETRACYWHQRSDDDGHLELRSGSAESVLRFIRATTKPYPGAWAIWKGRRVRLFAAEIPMTVIRGTPGRIMYLQGEGPFLMCADRAILLTQYEVEGDGVARLAHGAHLK